MIAYLSGTILSKQERNLVLHVSGIGYIIFVCRRLLEESKIGQPLELYIHTNVREDDLSLYGFETTEQWQFFKLLLTVAGIGPKSALEVLNAPLKKVQQSIAKKDVAWLTHIPGIGKKTAERIIVDLEGKVQQVEIEGIAENDFNASEDLIHALVSLGYHRQQVVQGLKKIPTEINGEEAIIKYFLQNI